MSNRGSEAPDRRFTAGTVKTDVNSDGDFDSVDVIEANDFRYTMAEEDDDQQLNSLDTEGEIDVGR